MNKVFLFFTILFAFSACSEDEQGEREFPQELVINGERDEMLSAAVIHDSRNGGVLDFLLYTEGVALLKDSSGIPRGASGNGYFLHFPIITSDSTSLKEGVYSTDSLNFDYKLGDCSINPVVHDNTQLWFVVESVSFELLQNNGTYTIVGSGQAENNMEYSFSYQGNIEWYLM